MIQYQKQLETKTMGKTMIPFNKSSKQWEKNTKPHTLDGLTTVQVHHGPPFHISESCLRQEGEMARENVP